MCNMRGTDVLFIQSTFIFSKSHSVNMKHRSSAEETEINHGVLTSITCLPPLLEGCAPSPCSSLAGQLRIFFCPYFLKNERPDVSSKLPGICAFLPNSSVHGPVQHTDLWSVAGPQGAVIKH